MSRSLQAKAVQCRSAGKPVGSLNIQAAKGTRERGWMLLR